MNGLHYIAKTEFVDILYILTSNRLQFYQKYWQRQYLMKNIFEVLGYKNYL